MAWRSIIYTVYFKVYPKSHHVLKIVHKQVPVDGYRVK